LIDEPLPRDETFSMAANIASKDITAGRGRPKGSKNQSHAAPSEKHVTANTSGIIVFIVLL
jgi:hypothetical protein